MNLKRSDDDDRGSGGYLMKNVDDGSGSLGRSIAMKEQLERNWRRRVMLRLKFSKKQRWMI